MKPREFYWLGEVCEKEVAKYIDKIMAAHNECPEEEITLWINNVGGSLALSYSFFEFIKAKEVNLITIGNGQVFSGGVILLMSGKKRMATEKTLFVTHPPYREICHPTILTPQDCFQVRRDLLRANQQLCEFLATICGKNLELFEEIYEEETEFSVKRAKELGLIHKVIKTVLPPP